MTAGIKVTFSDVVVYPRKYVGGRAVGFDYDSMAPAPTKDFPDQHSYERWAAWVDRTYNMSMRLHGISYKKQMVDLGFPTTTPRSELLNYLRFGERWCVRNLPRPTMRTGYGERVDMPDPEEEDAEFLAENGIAEVVYRY